MDDPRLQKKIKTRQELLELIGPRPRSKQVIMCHGTFDIVHPGHIRHLRLQWWNRRKVLRTNACNKKQ